MDAIAAAWSRLGALPLAVEEATLEPHSLETASGWTRSSTVVRLSGGSEQGRGEDVTYSGEEQLAFQVRGLAEAVGDPTTLAAWCAAAAELDLFAGLAPDQPVSRSYRRWALESAALDLALRQAGESLHGALGIEATPPRFAVSTGLGGKPSVAPLEELLARFPKLRFKLDWAPEWDAALLADLATLGRVDVVDLKGLYTGSFSGPAPDPDAYRAVAEALPEAWLEDPAWTPETAAALAPFRERVTWDVPLHAAADLDTLPFRPRCVNLKPSRFGSIAETCAFAARCLDEGIAIYGGGQFELGPGRLQAQHLAALWSADAPNDLSPVGYHAARPADGLPEERLPAVSDQPGFGRAS